MQLLGVVPILMAQIFQNFIEEKDLKLKLRNVQWFSANIQKFSSKNSKKYPNHFTTPTLTENNCLSASKPVTPRKLLVLTGMRIFDFSLIRD